MQQVTQHMPVCQGSVSAHHAGPFPAVCCSPTVPVLLGPGLPGSPCLDAGGTVMVLGCGLQLLPPNMLQLCTQRTQDGMCVTTDTHQLVTSY